MNEDRKLMEKALKEYCLPTLRKQKFKGTFPNYYRDTNGFITLINFQFISFGGQFCVNLGYADPERENIYYKPDTDIRKLKVYQTKDQIRLGVIDGCDRWFTFERKTFEPILVQSFRISKIAKTCAHLFETFAEDRWAERRARR